MAQQAGTVLGVVKDASGALVPGVQVTVTNTDTSLARTATTSDDGSYRVPALEPGHYSVKVEKSGFRTQTQTGLTLTVAQQMVVNLVLQVGATEQQITITGNAPIVNTTSSSTGSLVGESAVSDLPLNGRNFVDLTLIQPGVQLNYLQGGGGGGVTGTFFSSNGAPIRSNYFSLDGAYMLNVFGGGSSSQAGTTLGIDGIKEYKVVTHTFSAEYGLRMGSQAIIVSKGGSNNFHGDVFEYLRNSALDARNFFDNSAAIGRRLPQFQRNNFGAAFGGPIKKDKTFFYAVYEGLRERLGVTLTSTVLPSACHDLVPIGNGGTTTGLVVDQALENAPFPAGANLANPSACASGLTNTTVIPATVQPFIGQWPIVAANAAGKYLFPGAGKSTLREDFGQIRVDQNFSDTDMFFSRYTIDDADLYTPTTSIVLLSTSSGLPQWSIGGGSRNQFWTLGETHIFSPTVLNQISVSYSRTNLHEENIYNTTFLNPWGPLIGPQWSLANDGYGVPLVQGTVSPGGGVTGLGGSTTSPAYHIVNVGSIKDDVSVTRGKHAFMFGTLLDRYGQAEFTTFIQDGALSFSGVGNFMKGLPSTYRVMTAFPGSGSLNPVIPRYYTYFTLGFYAQDDYRVTPRLTLNLGLRYEVMAKLGELNNLHSYFPDLATSITFKIGPELRNYSLRNWSPRFGFAWDIFGDGKTALRGGWGIYYDVAAFSTTIRQDTEGMPPYAVQNQVQPNSVVPMTLPLTLNDFSVVGTSGLTLQGMDYNIQQPYTTQTTLTFERQLPFQTGISIGYVGTRGYHIWSLQEGNPCLPTSITNGVYSWVTDPANLTSNKANPTCPLGRVNPFWNSAVWYTSDSASWYHGLQTVVTKNLSRGLQASFAYTWSHSIDWTEGQARSADCTGAGNTFPINSFDLSQSKGPSCFDVRNAVRANIIYHLPGLKSNSAFTKVTNGWWLGTIWTIQGGVPFAPQVSGNRSLNGGLGGQVGEFPDLVTATTAGTGKAAGLTFVPYNPDTVITHDPNNWFNPLMFQLGPIGGFGNTQRGILRGPNEREIDLSINKDTPLHFLGEQGRIEFRAEFFNVINHTNFGFPNGTAYAGTQSDGSPFSEAPQGSNATNPFGTAGQITTTLTTSRQIQLALKVIF